MSRDEKQRLLFAGLQPTGGPGTSEGDVFCFFCFQRDQQQSLCPDLPDLLVPWDPRDLQGLQVSLFSCSAPTQQQAVNTTDSRHICSNPDSEGRNYGERESPWS